MRQVQEARRNPGCPLLPLKHEGPRTHQWESVIYREARYEPLNQLLYQNRKRRTMRTLMKTWRMGHHWPASAKLIKCDSQNMTQQKGNDTKHWRVVLVLTVAIFPTEALMNALGKWRETNEASMLGRLTTRFNANDVHPSSTSCPCHALVAEMVHLPQTGDEATMTVFPLASFQLHHRSCW